MVHCLADMGQNSSLPKGRKKSLKSRKNISHSLSHTFTLSENENIVELLNINTATEEELMTLHGVNREIAKNIVEYRKAIGRFRKVEDLVLVKGIGADKLQRIRSEICVSSRRLNSRASSRAPSYDSLKSTESRMTFKSNGYFNINKASVFEWQALNGINQETAAAIVHYREKRGKFKKVEDLLKVKGIDRIRLNNISSYLKVEDEELSTDVDENLRASILTNGYTMPYSNGRPYRFPKKATVINGLSNSSEADIFELLSAYSPRPVVQSYQYKNNDELAVRIGTWNLNEFSYEKANNPGVKEVICRTILENGLSILAVQDIVNVTALRIVCEELNNPTLHRVREWKDKQHNWNFCMLDVPNSKLGFIYDSDGVYDIQLVNLNEGPIETKKICEILIATFRIANMYLQLVTITLNNNTNIEMLNQKLKELTSEDDMLLVFIDLSNVKDTRLPLGDLKAIFSPNTKTNFSYASEKKTSHISNILYSSKLEKYITGTNCVIRQGLTHLAIPNGWSWGGPVSPYCPIWTELYVNSVEDTAL